MRQMLEAGVHFGHQTRYWNPKMACPSSVPATRSTSSPRRASDVPGRFKFVRQLTSNKADPFVGTKRQAREIVKEEAQRCRSAVRRLPLAGRHAHQLQTVNDQAPEGHGRDDRRRPDGAAVEEDSS